MDKLEYQVVMHRINEIEKDQLRYLDCVCKYLDSNIDMNREIVRDRMLQLREEKDKLIEYIK